MRPSVFGKRTLGQHISDLLVDGHTIDLDCLVKIDLLKHPMKIHVVVGAPAFNDHFDHGFVFSMLACWKCVRQVTLNRGPRESVDRLPFNITFMFSCSHQAWATGSSTSVAVSHEPNAGIPSIRKPASDDMNSASVLL